MPIRAVKVLCKGVIEAAADRAQAELQWRQDRARRISKRGDEYLRTLLIQGAKSDVMAAQRKRLAAAS